MRILLADCPVPELFVFLSVEINSVRLLSSQKKIIETLIYDFFLNKPNNSKFFIFNLHQKQKLKAFYQRKFEITKNYSQIFIRHRHKLPNKRQ